jgi:exoribonuclease-2
MHVFYEEAGSFKVASVLSEQGASLHVEAPHGKRSKIKTSSVLFSFEHPTPLEFMAQAQKVAEELDPDFLWECSGPEEFNYQDLAEEYFGRIPKPPEAAGIVMRLHDAPMYFYKRGHGRYKPAPADALAAAKASVERKRRQSEQQAQYIEQLRRRVLPKEFDPLLQRLLYAPDRNSLEWKALDAVCRETRLTPPRLLEACGALPSSHDYHFDRFLFEHFPQGTGFPDLPDPITPEDLPITEVEAFSIDDVSTTEIDDAFSLARLPDGNYRIGVHIAAPALGFAPGSELDKIAARRLSTIYTPARKITMLPEQVIESFSLKEGHTPPAVSLYFDVNAQDLSVIESRSKVERVKIAANLRHSTLETVFNEDTFTSVDHPFGEELEILWSFARELEAQRGKPEAQFRLDYNFYVRDDRVKITERRRGTPIDTLVSELMIRVNTEWGRALAENHVTAVYRTQSNGKVRMSTIAAPHERLGAEQYVWASSPLRRFVDLVNQRQIIALIEAKSPPFDENSEAILISLRDFEVVYDTYIEFQRTMERYWSLRWLLQESVHLAAATVIRENLVKLDGVPLITRVSSLPPLAAGSRVELEVKDVDLIELGVLCAFVRSLIESERGVLSWASAN